MTTFTLQDLTPEQQTAVNNHEEMHKMFNEIGTALTQPPVMPDTPINAQHAPEPQTTPDINTIINTICTQLQLLSTVISSSAPKTEAGENSLQECVALTLHQADWFRDIVRVELVGLGIEDIARDAVESVVENEVEHYFDSRFSPEDHFDFGDAVSDAVDDRLDDIVKEKIDECIEDVVAEKLSSASVSISF